MHAESFPPIAAPDARVLILGSLPGAMSLARQRYYAQPRNAFWPIMGELAGAAPILPYDERLARLRTARIAVWDVCASGFRPGSLDSAIRNPVANDFATFLRAHPLVRLICFNGATAANLFRRLALPTLADPPPRIVLPSTSPAHAGMPFAEKLRRWREGLCTVAETLGAG